MTDGPTEAEVQAERQKIRAEGEVGLAWLQRRGEKLAASEAYRRKPATKGDLMVALLHLHQLIRAESVDFCLEHVQRRAVLRGEMTPESRAVLSRWAGIYHEGNAYSKDALVAYKHGLWIAKRATTAEPGTPDGGWQLALRGAR